MIQLQKQSRFCEIARRGDMGYPIVNIHFR